MQRHGKPRSTSGPALPSKLNKEIDASNSEAGPRNERVSKAFALADRKAQRKAKRQQKGQQRLRFTQKLHQDASAARPPPKAASKKRQTRNEVRSGGSRHCYSPQDQASSSYLLQAAKPPAKRVKTSDPSPAEGKPHETFTAKQGTSKASRKPVRKASKFDELVQRDSLQVCCVPTCAPIESLSSHAHVCSTVLLNGLHWYFCCDLHREGLHVGLVLQGNGQQSIAAELALQKQLAKQMGLKGRTKVNAKGPDDGLDDFLEGDASELSAKHPVLCLACRTAFTSCQHAIMRRLDMTYLFIFSAAA